MDATEPLDRQEPTRMPNKTIYVSDSDLPVFERAQELAGGNLSATIAKALHGLVEREEGAKHGFKEVKVQVGTTVHMKKRFVGRLLVKGQDARPGQPLETTYTVYGTQKGRFVLHVETEPNWASPKHDPTAPQAYRLDIVDTLEELESLIPQELYDAAVVAAQGEDPEFLDI